MHYSYKPRGVCSSKVEFDVIDGFLKNIVILNGCDGNSKGLAALAEGMMPKEAALKLKGITCGIKKSSCPDQFALALEEFMKSDCE
ncbi:MAG: TIGR03905 family TSCPD domain-containing protein [Anaerotignum sp.]